MNTWFTSRKLGTLRRCASLVRLALYAIALTATPALTAEEAPEPMLTLLEFRVLDAGPDELPVGQFRYSFNIHSAAEEEVVRQSDVACRAEDGVFRIPEPFPPFGRIRVWIEADDLDKGYRYGFGSFSYRIDPDAATKPATIRLEEGIVLTGKVVDVETGKTLAGAEVAPMKWGHHFSWADWEEAVQADRKGRFRATAGSAVGIAARHAGYRDTAVDYRSSWIRPGINRLPRSLADGAPDDLLGRDSEGIVLRLRPLLTLRGRVLDIDGTPIADAMAGASRSDAQGRFPVEVTRAEWREREKRDVRFHADGFRSKTVPLADFAFERETVIVLEAQAHIEGQVLDEHGKPLEDCTIEVKCEAAPSGLASFVSDFRVVHGPYKQGKWRQPIPENAATFTVRISVADAVRSIKQYTRAEVTGGPISTRLGEGRQISGRLVAKVPLDENNTPVAFLKAAEDDDLRQQASIQPDGGFLFSGLADGKYTVQFFPAVSRLRRGGAVGGGVGAFGTFGFDSPNKPLEISVTIDGADVALKPIELHASGLLPGQVMGVAYHPKATGKPFANVFGYICRGEHGFDTVGGSYYLLRFATNAEGRFRADHCPPGQYVLRLSDSPHGYRPYDPAVWVRVAPEKAIELRLFAPEPASQLALRFIVRAGLPHDVHAATGLDAQVIAKHRDPKTGKLPFIQDDGERFRATPSEISCRLEPLDKAITHWPIYDELFELSPHNLLGDHQHHIVIPNLSPGRWRLTLTSRYPSVGTCTETFFRRDVTFTEGMAPLEVELPAAALAGTVEAPTHGLWSSTTVKAIPQSPDLPTRTCRSDDVFRFVGLAPGTYFVRFGAPGCTPKQIDDVIVREGETTWMEHVVLEEAPVGSDGCLNPRSSCARAYPCE